MNGLAILFSLLSFFSLLALPVALFRPRWLRLKCRLTAVFSCLYALAIFAGIGMWLDPQSSAGPEGGTVLLVVFGCLHLIILGAGWLFRKSTAPAFHESMQKRIDQLEAKSKSPLKRLEAYAKEKAEAVSVPDKQSVEPVRKVVKPTTFDGAISPEKLAEFEESLTTIWAGDTRTIEFTYEKPFGRGRSRRRVDVEEMMYDAKGRIILRGQCHERGEERTFREDRILTKIKSGFKRYEFDEWCEELLGVNLYEVVPAR